MATVAEAYIHGFGPVEEQRLRDQAAVLAPVVFADMDLPATGRLLELGCGVGAELDLLAARWPGLVLTGIDLSPSHLRAAGRHLDDRATLMRGNTGCLPRNVSVSPGFISWKAIFTGLKVSSGEKCRTTALLITTSTAPKARSAVSTGT